MKQVGLAQYIKLLVLGFDFILLNLLFAVFKGHCGLGHNGSQVVQTWQLWAIIMICFLICARKYRPMLYYRIVKEYKIVINIFSLAANNCLMAAIIFLFVYNYLPVSFFLLFYSSFFLILLVAHFVLRCLLRKYRKEGGNSRSVVFVGNTASMHDVYRKLTYDLSSGYIVMGYFDEKPAANPTSEIKYLGGINDVTYYLKGHPVDYVYCNLSLFDNTVFTPIIDYCENHLIRIFAVPSFSGDMSINPSVKHLGHVPILAMRKEPLTRLHNILWKRLFDLVFSTLFLVTLFPIILLVVAIGIKISSPGPIFFRQRRSGRMGKEFDCFKFRSMAINSQSDSIQATQDDPRVTPFGRFLRKTSIDELPQFINVFLGDMSVVGPRPHMLLHTEKYSEIINKYMVRHYVKPGITGWAQVTGFRGEIHSAEEMANRIKQDIWYIEHWSLQLDLYIIARTIYNVVKGDKKAY
jgi:putative colanic acid biosynthesis UDP-glucose lipid carrier transferase